MITTGGQAPGRAGSRPRGGVTSTHYHYTTPMNPRTTARSAPLTGYLAPLSRDQRTCCSTGQGFRLTAKPHVGYIRGRLGGGWTYANDSLMQQVIFLARTVTEMWG